MAVVESVSGYRLAYLQGGKRLIAHYDGITQVFDTASGKLVTVFEGLITGLSHDETLGLVTDSFETLSVRLEDGLRRAVEEDAAAFAVHERLIVPPDGRLGLIDAAEPTAFYPPPPLKLGRDETGHWMNRVQKLGSLVVYQSSWDTPMIYGWDFYVYDLRMNKLLVSDAVKSEMPRLVYTPSLNLLARQAAYDYQLYDLTQGGSGRLSLSDIDRRGYLTPEEAAREPRRSSVLRYIETIAVSPRHIAAALKFKLVLAAYNPPVQRQIEYTQLWAADVFAPTAMTFSPDGAVLAALLTSGEVRLYDVESGAVVRVL